MENTQNVPDFKAVAPAIKLGISSFITQVTIVIISLVCNIMLAKYGAMSAYGVNIPIALIAIESKVFTVVVNIIVGIVLGCQPIIGYNTGARNFSRIKRLYLARARHSLLRSARLHSAACNGNRGLSVGCADCRRHSGNRYRGSYGIMF